MTGIRRYNYWVPGATFCRIRDLRLPDRVPGAMACGTTPRLQRKLGPVPLAWLTVAAMDQQGGDVTEGESCHDRDERLLVELARL